MTGRREEISRWSIESGKIIRKRKFIGRIVKIRDHSGGGLSYQFHPEDLTGNAGEYGALNCGLLFSSKDEGKKVVIIIKEMQIDTRHKWELINHLVIEKDEKTIRLSVGTAYLQGYKGGNKYQTIIFTGYGTEVEFPYYIQGTYKTRKEAEKNHKQIIATLKSGVIDLEPIIYTLKLRDYNWQVKE